MKMRKALLVITGFLLGCSVGYIFGNNDMTWFPMALVYISPVISILIILQPRRKG